VGAQDFNSLQPYAQLVVGLPFNMKSDKPAVVEARVGYAYETLDSNRAFHATATDGTGFTLPGVSPSRGMFSAGMGLTMPVSKAMDLTASYDRLFDTGNVSGQTFQLQATYRF
jgi:outer membrane autotransporter protein